MSRFFIAGVLATVAPSLSAADIPAFPGAEGFAAFARGGRDGDVYTVTNLEAKGPGSFQNGIATVPPAGRTIVFAVSGYIPIRKLHLTAGKVTIAGQTAPGGGVGLVGSSWRISGSDVVVRHLRLRHGAKGNGGDCLNPDGDCQDLIIDHCAMEFSADENCSMFRAAPKRFTFQWSINAWGLQHHSAGGLWQVDHTTAHHCLWANNHTRNPKVIQPRLLEWINNVTFGWDIGMNMAGGEQPGTYRITALGSWFIHGGNTRSAIFGGGLAKDGSTPFHLHIADCALDGAGDGRLAATATDHGVVSSAAYIRAEQPFPRTLSADPTRRDEPEIGIPVRTDDRLTALKKVLSQVGPLDLALDPALAEQPPLRDAADTLLVQEVAAHRRHQISSEEELGLPGGGFGPLRSGVAFPDGDRDGMPDVWEMALGWDPAQDDHNQPLSAVAGRILAPSFLPPDSPAGYTRLEEYLHFCAIPHAFLTAGGPALRCDLRRFTAGFTAAPTFSWGEVVGGTLVGAGPGNALVTFTPTPGFSGRAGFDFTVRDAEGSTWTQRCALLIVPAKR